MKTSIKNSAKKQGLEIINITSSLTGYPGNDGSGVIGFKNYDEANDFALKFGGEISIFHQKAGWNFWNNKGTTYRPLSYMDYLKDLGDEFYSTILVDAEVSFNNLLKDLKGYEFYESAYEELKSNFETLKNELESKSDDQVVIVCNGKYYETIDKVMMKYKEDTNTYVIGVYYE